MVFRVLPEATAELDDIWLYVARESGSIDTASRLIDTITDRFFILGQHHELGCRCDRELRPGLRTFPVSEYIIIYRTEGEDVLILHVIRGSRNIKALLRD